MTAASSASENPDDRPPGIVLSRWAFTVILLLVASLPIVIVSILVYAMPVNPYPPLDVTLELAVATGENDPTTGEPSRFAQYRLVNAGDEELYRVVVYAKDIYGNRFEFNFDETLPPGEELRLDAGDLALRTAQTLKQGAQLESMEVSARLPSGARGLSEWSVENERPIPVEKEVAGERTAP